MWRLFFFSKYYHQAIYLIESKIYKPLPPQPYKKPSENVCSIFFENKGVVFMKRACTLWDPEKVKSFSISFAKFLCQWWLTNWIYIYPLSFQIKFVNDLDKDVFLTNLDRLPYNNSPFANRHHKHVVREGLRIFETMF